jgi:nitrite reductase/ring-hydroxylating ferredoxin subunit
LGEGLNFGKNIKCPVHGYIFDLTKHQCINQFMLKIGVYSVEFDGDKPLLMPRSKASGESM